MTDLGKARTADRNFPIARYRWGKTRVEGERERWETRNWDRDNGGQRLREDRSGHRWRSKAERASRGGRENKGVRRNQDGGGEGRHRW